MLRQFNRRLALSLSILMVLSFSFSSAMADPGHGRGRGQGHGRRWDRDHVPPGQMKKARKFVNGHDARDGRRDGRGPRHRRHRW